MPLFCSPHLTHSRIAAASRRIVALAVWPLLITELAIAVASGIVWARCGLSHPEDGIASCPDELLCLAAGAGALAVAVGAISIAAHLARRGASPAAFWSLAGALLAAGYAGTSGMLLGLTMLGFEAQPPVLARLTELSATAGYAGAVTIGAAAAAMLAVRALQQNPGRRTRALGRTMAIGIVGVVAAWCIDAAVQAHSIGTASVQWTADPSMTTASFLAAVTAAGIIRLHTSLVRTTTR